MAICSGNEVSISAGENAWYKCMQQMKNTVLLHDANMCVFVGMNKKCWFDLMKWLYAGLFSGGGMLATVTTEVSSICH